MVTHCLTCLSTLDDSVAVPAAKHSSIVLLLLDFDLPFTLGSVVTYGFVLADMSILSVLDHPLWLCVSGLDGLRRVAKDVLLPVYKLGIRLLAIIKVCFPGAERLVGVLWSGWWLGRVLWVLQW